MASACRWWCLREWAGRRGESRTIAGPDPAGHHPSPTPNLPQLDVSLDSWMGRAPIASDPPEAVPPWLHHTAVDPVQPVSVVEPGPRCRSGCHLQPPDQISPPLTSQERLWETRAATVTELHKTCRLVQVLRARGSVATVTESHKTRQVGGEQVIRNHLSSTVRSTQESEQVIQCTQ